MTDLLTLLLALRLYAHLEHVTAKGVAFFSDHEYLRSVYEAYDHDYDRLAERLTGANISLDLYAVATDAAALLNTMKDGNTFAVLLEGEKKLCSEISTAMRSASVGTQDLLTKIAGHSEQRQYQISRRLA